MIISHASFMESYCPLKYFEYFENISFITTDLFFEVIINLNIQIINNSQIKHFQKRYKVDYKDTAKTYFLCFWMKTNSLDSTIRFLGNKEKDLFIVFFSRFVFA